MDKRNAVVGNRGISPVTASAPPSEGAISLLEALQNELGNLRSDCNVLVEKLNFIICPFPEGAEERPVKGNSQMEIEISKALNMVWGLQGVINNLRTSIRL